MATDDKAMLGLTGGNVWLRAEARLRREGQTGPVAVACVEMPDAAVDDATLDPNPVLAALAAYDTAQAAWEAAHAEVSRTFSGRSQWAHDNARDAEKAARATRDAALVDLNNALRAARGA